MIHFDAVEFSESHSKEVTRGVGRFRVNKAHVAANMSV